MLGTYYYHEIIKKTITGFGTLFNQIYIKHKDSNDNDYSEMRVPLAYSPIQKFLARLQQQSNLNKPVQITLPRMSFEMVSLTYDPSRKTTVTQTFKAVDANNNVKKVFMPVPYNIGFQLNIYTKLNEDALQIIEQILPFFQPGFNITIDLVSSIGEKRDIPVILDNITFKDEYEVDFSTRRALIYTLSFTAKTYLFGPIADSTEGLIKKVQVDLYSNTDTINARREVRYVVTPQARKDYNNDNTSTLISDISVSSLSLNVNSTTSFAVDDRIIIDNEIMLITNIVDENTLNVRRSYDNTTAAVHLSDSVINKLTVQDDALIEPDDDFGFNDDWYDFSDSKLYSPTQQRDI